MLTAFALAIGSAVLHSAWNLIVKATDDRLVAIAAQSGSGALASLLVLVPLGLPHRSVWVYVAGSSVLHLVYNLSLVAAYDRADLSVAYPVARGMAPTLAAVGGVVLLDDQLTPLAFAGVLVVSAALIGFSVRGAARAGVGWAVFTGVMISSYTVVDAAAVRVSGDSLRYVLTLTVVTALLVLPVTALRRPMSQVRRVLQRSGVRLGITGPLSVGAYGLVLVAVQLAPVGFVAAIRETSVVFGALAGWLILREPFGGRRTLGAVGVAMGIALLILT